MCGRFRTLALPDPDPDPDPDPGGGGRVGPWYVFGFVVFCFLKVLN